MTYYFTLTREQLTEFFKKQARKALQMLLVSAIVFSVLVAVCLVWYVLAQDDETANVIAALIFLVFFTFLIWFMYALVRRNVPKNAENYYKFHNIDGLVEFLYELKETEFVVTQPTIGNVNHFKYDMVQKVSAADGYAVVTLVTNQFLPILVNDETAQLVSSLKSVAKTK